MASNFEKGGKPGVEMRPEPQPKKQNDPKVVRQALGKTALQGPQKKK
jgi:hypothetical protein